MKFQLNTREKRILLLAGISLLMSVQIVIGQTTAKEAFPSIVPNGDFERYSNPPIGWFYNGKHFTQVMQYWSSPSMASPDVFGPRVRVPSHWKEKGFGEQAPQRGESMVGITCYGCKKGKPHCREYVQIQLSEPLVIGQRYLVEMWVSHLPRSLSINNIGAAFVEEKMGLATDKVLELTPQVNTQRVIIAQGHKWLKLSGRFVAEAEHNYMVVGNFFPDSLTSVQQFHENSLNYAYYYIDNITVRKEQPIIDVPIKADDLTRIPLEEGKIIQLKNIFFDTDKYDLHPRSYIELNKLLGLMLDNPNMVIEIRGHTDIVGDHNYNLELSRKRSEAVVKFLNENSISPLRTRYKGFGATQPIASNQTQDGRQLNRRVEFLILKK